jgi:PPK2 family polyphosphate:nucleotide phosphotransferase
MKLKDFSTSAPKEWDKAQIKIKIQELIKELDELQNIMFAQRKYSVLVVIQGMDASGKDGLIKNIFTGINPMGCDVISFKAPTEEELSHDFLWRIHQHAPQKGMIQVFNRSHYEDVLVTRVHNWIDDKLAEERFRHINNFEKLLLSNNTIVLKFYLHISQEEQTKRLTERINDPTKKWKYNENDWEESKLWDSYMKMYEDVFENCSKDIPWIITPSDQNWMKEYTVIKTLVEEIKKLDLKYPEVKNT